VGSSIVSLRDTHTVETPVSVPENLALSRPQTGGICDQQPVRDRL